MYCLPIDISEDSHKIVFTVHSYKDINILYACLYLLLVLFVLSVSLHRELADSGHTLWFLLWQPLFILFPYLTQLLQTNERKSKRMVKFANVTAHQFVKSNKSIRLININIYIYILILIIIFIALGAIEQILMLDLIGQITILNRSYLFFEQLDQWWNNSKVLLQIKNLSLTVRLYRIKVN